MTYAVLGADGQIGSLLVKQLVADGKMVRAISRQWNGQPFGAAVEYRTADALNTQSLVAAIQGCEVVYSVLGLPYVTKIWEQLWQPMVQNVGAAALQTGARLVYFDNVYAYGYARGEMTEETPYAPTSRKGVVRAAAAQWLERQAKTGGLKLIIARSADFIGPGAQSSIVGARFFNGIVLAGGPVRSAEWLGNPHTKHCYNFTSDIVRALSLLGDAPDALYGQTWHLPTSAPITGDELCRLIGEHTHCIVKLRPVGSWMLRVAGLFLPIAREQAEMQYQVEHDYLFSDAKFMRQFPTFVKTPWPQIIPACLKFFGSKKST